MSLAWPPRSGRVLATRSRRTSTLIVGVVTLIVGYLAGRATCADPRTGVEPALFDAVEQVERCALALDAAERDRREAIDTMYAYQARVDGGVVRTLVVLADNPWVCRAPTALRLPRAGVPPVPEELAAADDSS